MTRFFHHSGVLLRIASVLLFIPGITVLSASAQNGYVEDNSNRMCKLQKYEFVDTVMTQAEYLYELFDKENDFRENLGYLLQTGGNMKLWIPKPAAYLDSVQFAYGKEQCLEKLFDEWYEKSGSSGTDFYTVLGKLNNDGKLKNRVCLGLLWIEFEEDEPGQEWVLEDETRMIGDLECHKAVSDFRGHHWTAWYAPSIPFTEAPWKFSPLPGIAVEIASEDNAHSFRLKAVKEIVKPMLWEIPQHNWIQTDRKKFIQAQRAAVTNLAHAASIIGGEGFLPPGWESGLHYSNFLEKE